MTATALVAAALGIVVGVVIGGLGGGGGVLTVPALVYVLGQDAHDATTGGVLIVGVTALVGTLVRVRERGIEWRTGIAFGAVGVPAAYLGTLLNRNVDQPALLIAFACLTLLAAAAIRAMSCAKRERRRAAGRGGLSVIGSSGRSGLGAGTQRPRRALRGRATAPVVDREEVHRHQADTKSASGERGPERHTDSAPSFSAPFNPSARRSQRVTAL